MHPDKGTLQAYVDDELPGSDRQQVTQHLSDCNICQETVEEISRWRSHIQASLNQLNPESISPRISSSVARAHLMARLSEQEKPNMIQKLFSKRLRPLWASVMVIAILAVALAFPSVQVIANNFLGLFRVERITVVPVDENQLANRLGSSQQMENLFSDTVSYQGGGEIQKVQGREEASSLANLTVRLPSALAEPAHLLVQPGGSISMVIDVRQLRAILKEVDLENVDLPDSLDGETVSVEVPNLVISLYGDCPDPTAEQAKTDPDGAPVSYGSNCMELVQIQSPTVNAPPDLNINQLGQALLQVLGMSPEEAAQFSASVDWTTTLILPVPSANTTYQDVTVDGVPGTLIVQGNLNDPYHYMLVWVKNGVIYGLSGSDDPQAALELANSLQ